MVTATSRMKERVERAQADQAVAVARMRSLLDDISDRAARIEDQLSHVIPGMQGSMPAVDISILLLKGRYFTNECADIEAQAREYDKQQYLIDALHVQMEREQQS